MKQVIEKLHAHVHVGCKILLAPRKKYMHMCKRACLKSSTAKGVLKIAILKTISGVRWCAIALAHLKRKVQHVMEDKHGAIVLMLEDTHWARLADSIHALIAGMNCYGICHYIATLCFTSTLFD